MPKMCIAFFFVNDCHWTFFNATVHTTLPLTSSFLISLAVQFLCVSRLTNQSKLTANIQQTHNQQPTNSEQGDETRRYVVRVVSVVWRVCTSTMIFTCFLHVMVLVPLTFHNVSSFLRLAAVSSTVSHVEQRQHVENCLKLLREARND